MTAARVLYLTYDGLTDPLGQSQVLPYLKGLAARGHRITVLSSEKPEALARAGEAIASKCSTAGIDWKPLRYHKRPPILSTVADLTTMAKIAARLHRVEPFDLVHCRSYLPALIGRSMQRRTGVKFLFDMRGFWIDERFERGIWNRRSPAYRLVGRWFRQREQQLFRDADAVVTLTEAARDQLRCRGGDRWASKTTVIPCCADLAHFDPAGGRARKQGRALLRIPESAPVLLFLGSLGGAYPLDPVARFFRRWSEGRPDAQLLMVTRHNSAEVLADPVMASLADRVIVRGAERDEVPKFIAAADAALSFILPSPCAVASSPTKIGEILAMGVPIAANVGIGDIGLMLSESSAAILLPDLDDASVDRAAVGMRSLNVDPLAARAIAERWFSLETGVDRYDDAYHALLRMNDEFRRPTQPLGSHHSRAL